MGPQGIPGPIGPTGPCGPRSAGTVIPFSVGNTTAALSTNGAGAAGDVMLSSFGSHSTVAHPLIDGQFTLPAGDGSQHAFVLPYTAKVKRISVNFTNAVPFNAPTGAKVYPYVVLAVASPASDAFTVITATEAVAGGPWIGGSTVPAGAALSGFISDVNISISKDSRIAICCALKTPGMAIEQTCFIYYSGGILFE